MIQTKEDLIRYLAQDKGRYPTPPRFMSWVLHTEKYYTWKQIRCLRKLEYWQNTQTNIFRRFVYYLRLVHYYRLMHKTQIYIYPNVFGPGLYIPHLGRILFSAKASVGENCTLRPGLLTATNLGVTNRKERILKVGNNVEFSEGCKILCTKIGNNVTIGPNTVVISKIPDNVTVFGNPCEILPK